ncbi:MAG TPA: AAA family ATPase [Hymenobacter sp.]|jgi:hypothetical protein|uniref:AAA family ATPase n=1 Tax=Hymenobacter sp. TaxID=1898978 RepID=UPI002EDAAB46
MQERLIIRNFAGLNVELDVGEITIFIGPQASGKSVCARCLYWFRSFFSDLTFGGEVGPDKRSMDALYLEGFKEYFPNLWQTTVDFSVRYEIGEAFAEIKQEKKRLRLIYSTVIQNLAAELRTQLRLLEEKYTVASPKRASRPIIKQAEIDKTRLIDEWMYKIWDVMGSPPFLDQDFVIAGRSIFSALKGTLLTFLSTTPVTDPLLRDFLRAYEFARNTQPSPDESHLKSLAPLVEYILKGQLVTRQDDDLLMLTDGRQISLTHASSGQQEAFPLILFLLSFLSDQKSVAHALYVEEPEAHLYPDSQWAIVRLMASVFNLSLVDFSSRLTITTHSPYLLSTFNNLIRAHQLAEQFKNSPQQLKALYRIVPKNQQLALDDFRVYALADGKARSIISAEDGLIVADKLDEVSERISQQFDKLLQLEAQAAANEKAS